MQGVVLLLSLLVTLAFCAQTKDLPALKAKNLAQGRAAKAFDSEAFPPAQYDVMFDREVLVTTPKGPLKGIIIAFPGCDQLPTQWGITSHHCPLCAGLPEELQIVATALHRKYAVITVGPHLSGPPERCWIKTFPPENGIEVPELKRAIRHILEERRWWRLPRYIYGASAGGAAGLLFAFRFPVQAIASQLMGFKPDEIFEVKHLTCQNMNQGEGLHLKWPYPPVMLLEAEFDTDLYKDRLHKTLDFLKQQNVHVEHVIMQAYPLHPLFFSERIPEVDAALSAVLYDDLEAAGFINATGFTDYPTDKPEDLHRVDTSRDKLHEVLMKHFSHDMGIKGPLHDGYMRAFQEMFYASQGAHEIRAKEMDLIIDFFEREGQPDLMPINGDMHDLVGQDDSAAEVLMRRTGCSSRYSTPHCSKLKGTANMERLLGHQHHVAVDACQPF